MPVTEILIHSMKGLDPMDRGSIVLHGPDSEDFVIPDCIILIGQQDVMDR